ncbi:MAG: hypothetical protein K2M43_01620 [Mycoplasmoidaceae bacterium]|nr:hypothetical protein [Mycoplasmoidaceae bacterium]
MHVSNSGLQEIYDKTVTGDEYSKYPNGIAFLTLLDIDPNKQGAVDDV